MRHLMRGLMAILAAGALSAGAAGFTLVNVGTSVGDTNADGLRTAFSKINTNWGILSTTNAGSLAVDVGVGHSWFATNQPFALTGLTGVNATNYAESLMMIANTSDSNITVTLPTAWRTPDGEDAYTLTNGNIGQIRVRAYGSVATNAEWHEMW